MNQPGDEKTIMARAQAQARADLPEDADGAAIGMYAALLFRKTLRGHKNEDAHVKQVAIQEIDQRLKALRDHAHHAKFDRYVAGEKQKAENHDPLAAFASAPSFARYTKQGATPGAEPVRVIAREDIDAFLFDMKHKAAARGLALDFKNLFDLSAKKFGLTKQNLDSPAMTHVKAALLAEQTLEKQRARERDIAQQESVPVSAEQIQEFMKTQKNRAGYDPGDMLSLLDQAKTQFGINTANYALPRYDLLKQFLCEEMVRQGYTTADDAGFTLELLMG